MQRSGALWACLAALLLIACGGGPHGGPAPAPQPVAAGAASTAAETLASDTPQRTPGGATFTAPAGWTIRKEEGHVLLEGPEPDLRVAIVDTRAASAEEAVKSAWPAMRPDFRRPLRVATPAAARKGWDERRSFEYETSPNERRVVLAKALRHGEGWTVLLIDAADAAYERREAQIELIEGSLRPRGYERESFAGRTPHTLDAERIRQITGVLDRGREITGVPGAALSLVQGGKVVFEGGFGVRELGRPAKVDEDTLFLIASNTKALTTLLLARLVDEGKLTWSTPVIEVAPWFRLGDAETTRQVQMRHLVCACTGLPTQDYEMFFEFRSATPESWMKLLGTFQPTTRFGETYQYSNLLAAAAGYVAGEVLYPAKDLGRAYDEAMRTHVFESLGMRETTFDFARALRADHASPHAEDVDGHARVASMAPNLTATRDRPSGGAWSSVRDLTRYVRMELARGELPDGARLVSEENLLVRRAPQVAMGEDMTYGMGLIVDRQWGTPIVYHTGFLFGYRSVMFWLPEAGVGGVLLTNADNGEMLLRPYVRRTLEVLFDGKPEAEEDIAVAAKAHAARLAKTRARLTVPPDPSVIAKLARRYVSPALGELVVREEGARCIFDFGEWQTEVATRKNDDGTITMYTISPAVSGFEFVIAERGGRRALVLRDAQHEYVFVETP